MVTSTIILQMTPVGLELNKCVVRLTCFSGIPSKYKALKQDLYSTNPPDDLAALQRRLGKRVEGTCEWILDRQEFCNWLSSPDIQLLRLVGEPGIGKSMISSYLVEELKRECQKTENAIFSYYFFDNKDESRRTASVFLRTLLLQLLRQEPALFQFIEPDYQ
jgi:ankyrin repeat domain-containing protein 50